MEGYAHKLITVGRTCSTLMFTRSLSDIVSILFTHILRAYARIKYTTVEQLATSSFWNHLKSSATASSLTNWQDELEDETLV